MILKELVLKYIKKTEEVLTKLTITSEPIRPDKCNIREIVEKVKRYFEDSKYYLEKKKFETSLTSIAYCEGLLDALRLLNYIEFSR
jgi:FAD synthetase